MVNSAVSYPLLMFYFILLPACFSTETLLHTLVVFFLPSLQEYKLQKVETLSLLVTVIAPESATLLLLLLLLLNHFSCVRLCVTL